MCLSVPNVGYTVFWTTHHILTIRRYATLNHQVFTFSTKESLSDSRPFHGFIFNKSNAIVSWMHEKLVLIFWMYDYLIDLITFKFFLSDFEVIISIEITISDWNIPYTDMTSGITDKESTILIESHTVRMNIVLHTIR